MDVSEKVRRKLIGFSRVVADNISEPKLGIFARGNFAYLKARDNIELQGLRISYFEPVSFYYELRDIFKKRIYHFEASTQTPFILDCGSYIGLSILYAKSLYADAKIIGFEPDPSIFQVLERNVKVNKLTDVQLVNAALGAQETELEFIADGADGGHLTKYGSDSSENTVKVKCVKLSDYIDRPVDLLKMNIEGAEWEVFQEIQSKLPQIKEIIIEYHGFPELTQTLHNLLGLLHEKGFRYLIHDFGDDANASTKPPFRLNEETRFFELIYAKNMRTDLVYV